jgi:hypothetical protein
MTTTQERLDRNTSFQAGTFEDGDNGDGNGNNDHRQSVIEEKGSHLHGVFMEGRRKKKRIIVSGINMTKKNSDNNIAGDLKLPPMFVKVPVIA